MINLTIEEAIEVNMEGIEVVFRPDKKVNQGLFDELMVSLLEEHLGCQAEDYLTDVKMALYFYFDAAFESIFNAEDVQGFIMGSESLQHVVRNVSEWIAEDLEIPTKQSERFAPAVTKNQKLVVANDKEVQSEQLTLF